MKIEDAIKYLKYDGCTDCTNKPSSAYMCDCEECTYKQAVLVAVKALETGEVYMTSKDYDLFLEGYKKGMGDYKKIVEENEQLKEELERPQGEWLEHTERITLDTYYECSNCKEPWTTIEGTPWQNMMNYCPNCGAKMYKIKKEINNG